MGFMGILEQSQDALGILHRFSTDNKIGVIRERILESQRIQNDPKGTIKTSTDPSRCISIMILIYDELE